MSWRGIAIAVGRMTGLLRKETPGEYDARHRRMEQEREHKEWIRKLEYQDRQARKMRERERLNAAVEAARDDVLRAQQGYAPGQGYVARDGRVYTRKETPEEYAARKIRNLQRQAEKIRRGY